MLADIYELSIRAILGGFLLIICCLIALSISRKSESARKGIFFVFTGAIALVSGILIATALYIAQNPPLLVNGVLVR